MTRGAKTTRRVFLAGAAAGGAAYASYLAGLWGARDTTTAVADPGFLDPETGTVRLVDTTALSSEIVVDEDVGIIIRDGTRLSAKVFRPIGAGPFPVVMALTAYGKDRGPEYFPPILNVAREPDYDLGRISVSDWITWEAPDPAFWVPRGYALVYVDSRGYGLSDGSPSILSEQDGLDFHDAIEWAGAQDWSNGNVGLNGVSYLAIAQWVAASTRPPSLKAVIPWEGNTDSFREVLFHGGIPETAFTEFWLNRMRSLGHGNPLPPGVIMNFALQRPLLMQTLQQRFVRSGIALENVDVPALICATWSDQGLHSRGSFEAYKRISSDQKWLFTHGRGKWDVYYSAESLQTQLAFFDHFLKGEDNGFENRPRVRLEIRETLQEYAVRDAEDWPLPGMQETALHLDATNGSLVRSAPDTNSQVRYDPTTEAAAFQITFDADTEISGNMKLKLWVSTDRGDDMDLFVGVEKLDADGQEVTFFAKTGYLRGPVAMGWLRVSLRDLDEARSTPLQPVQAFARSLPLAPGEIVPVEIEILPSSTLFRAGETLRLVVQGRDLFDHPMLAHEDTANEGHHILHTGQEHDSHLLVPLLSRQ